MTTDTGTENYRPAFVADVRAGDLIRYTHQTLDTTGDRPVVVDHVITTRVATDPVPGHNGNSSIVTWVDGDGATHRNRVDFHVEILAEPIDTDGAGAVVFNKSGDTDTTDRSRDMNTTITIESITIDANDIDATVESYRNATAGEKTKIRNAVTAAMGDAVRAMDIDTARLWSAVGDALAAARPAPVAVDMNRVIADRIIALRYAAHRLTMGDVTPDGIESDSVDYDAVRAMIAEFESAGDPDAVSNDVATAGDRIATTKITRSTVRGSIESHIESAFAELPVGSELTVAQIRTRSGAASDGAIAARVWPRNGKESTLDFTALGVEPCMIDGVRGMRKIG